LKREDEHGRMTAMQTLDVVQLREITEQLAASGRRVEVLWQQPGSLAFRSPSRAAAW
jgi:hypothetical protein